MSESTIDFPLPPEILYDILLLLPFESILACKRVSKKCKNLVNDPNFSKRYHHRGSLILTIVENILYCVLFRHNNITGFSSHTVHRLPITLTRYPTADPEVLSGPSNGIACVKASNGYFHLINLFTGVSHTVKDAPQRLHSFSWIRYGFGYDHHDDDYKIMVVCNYNNRRYLNLTALTREEYEKFQNKENTLFWVYSSKTGTWKKYDGFFSNTRYSWTLPAGFYFYNGVLHSLVHTNKSVCDARKPVILTFDLHTCSFGEISVPGDYNENLHSWMFVTEFDGRLCCSYWSGYERAMELYGGGGCWKKWESLNYSFMDLKSPVCNWLLRADLYDGRKVVLLVFKWKFVWCDLVNRKVKVVYMTPSWLRKEETKGKVEAMLPSLSQFCL